MRNKITENHRTIIHTCDDDDDDASEQTLVLGRFDTDVLRGRLSPPAPPRTAMLAAAEADNTGGSRTAAESAGASVGVFRLRECLR